MHSAGYLCPSPGLAPPIIMNSSVAYPLIYPIQCMPSVSHQHVPKYTQHSTVNTQHRLNSKTKTVSTELRPSTNKDRYMEEQKKKFRRFSRSGLTVSDADTLVDHLFEPQPWKPLPPYQTRTLPSMPHVGAGHNSGHIGPDFGLTSVVPGSCFMDHASRTCLKLPAWCYDSGRNLPLVYRHVLEAVSDGGNIVTEFLYAILMRSGLSKDHLRWLWDIVSTHTAGVFTHTELWILLGLVALSQHNYKVESTAILKRCHVPPIPHFDQSPTTDAANPCGAVVYDNSTSSVSQLFNGGRSRSQGCHLSTSVVPAHQQQTCLPVVAPSLSNAVYPVVYSEEEFSEYQEALSGRAVASMTTASGSASERGDSHEMFPGGQKHPSCAIIVSTPGCPLSTGHVPQAADNDSLTANEQYSSNVGVYFGNSDSSTGHDVSHMTSALTEHTHTSHCGSYVCSECTSQNSIDDDLSCGRSSSSHTGTSEQSENDDIRAFEMYVAKFKKAGAGDLGSVSEPLNSDPCPPVKATSSSLESDLDRAHSEAAFTTACSASDVAAFDVCRSISSPVAIDRTFSPADLESTPNAVFADFICAPRRDGEAVSTEVSLLGDEDRYDALRSLTTDMFCGGVFESAPGNVSTEPEDGWADFSSFSIADGPQDPAVSPAVHSAECAASVSDDRPNPNWSISCSDSNGSLHTTSTTRSGDILVLATTVGFTVATGAPAEPAISASSLGSEQQACAISVLSRSPAVTSSTQRRSDDDDPAHNCWSDFKCASPKLSHCYVDRNGAGCVRNADLVSGSCVGADVEPLCHTAQAESSQVADTPTAVGVVKQYLSEAEIVGVFRVRDDPVTLSSYKLSRPPVMGQPFLSDCDQPSDRNSAHSIQLGGWPGTDGTELSDEEQHSCSPPPLDTFLYEDVEHYSHGYDDIDVDDDIVHQSGATTTVGSLCRPDDGGIQNPMDERDALPTPLSEQSSATPLSELSPATPLSELSPATPLSELSPATPLSELSPATTEDTHAFCNRSYRSHNDSRIVDFFVPDGCAGGGVRVSDGTSLEDQHLDQRLSSDVFADTEGANSNSMHSMPSTDPSNCVTTCGPLNVDKYNIDGHLTCQTSQLRCHWERCMTHACRQIQKANELFNTISSSDVCSEVLRSEHGADYVLGLVEVYGMVRRIMAALPLTEVSSANIDSSLRRIDLDWNNLAAFLVRDACLPDESAFDYQQALLRLDDLSSKRKACGVCLLDVDFAMCTGEGGRNVRKLSHGGHQYHAPCANFWVNCVDSTLPALTFSAMI